MSWNRPPAARRQRRRGGRIIALVFVAFAVVVVALAGGGFLYGRGQLGAPSPGDRHQVAVNVLEGESLDQVIDDLDGHHLLKSRGWFALYAHWVKNLGGHLQSGRHQLSPDMGASALVAALEAPADARLTKVVLPEGLMAAQMGERLQSAGSGISAQQYAREVQKGSFSAPFLAGRPAGASLEGFLFPDTYVIPEGTTAHQFVQMQLDEFASKAAPIVAQAHGALNGYQDTVLASIIEREAQQPADRPLVASVLVNRLAMGMRLQVDASVSYGVGRTAGAPTDAEIHDPAKDTPYNTYNHPGLPPTPISNPGLASLQAAVTPAQSPYLYYVSDNCGKNYYAVTQQEFEQQVQQHLGKSCT